MTKQHLNVPIEIVRVIVDFAADSHAQLLEIGKVCKEWRELTLEYDLVWKKACHSLVYQFGQDDSVEWRHYYLVYWFPLKRLREELNLKGNRQLFAIADEHHWEHHDAHHPHHRNHGGDFDGTCTTAAASPTTSEETVPVLSSSSSSNSLHPSSRFKDLYIDIRKEVHALRLRVSLLQEHSRVRKPLQRFVWVIQPLFSMLCFAVCSCLLWVALDLEWMTGSGSPQSSWKQRDVARTRSVLERLAFGIAILINLPSYLMDVGLYLADATFFCKLQWFMLRYIQQDIENALDMLTLLLWPAFGHAAVLGIGVKRFLVHGDELPWSVALAPACVALALPLITGLCLRRMQLKQRRFDFAFVDGDGVMWRYGIGILISFALGTLCSLCMGVMKLDSTAPSLPWSLVVAPFFVAIILVLVLTVSSLRHSYNLSLRMGRKWLVGLALVVPLFLFLALLCVKLDAFPNDATRMPYLIMYPPLLVWQVSWALAVFVWGNGVCAKNEIC